MYYLNIPQNHLPKLSFYLAVEEYAARYLPQERIFFYWQVEPSVIIGRNQCLESEVNMEYCRNHNISVYRRKSGGGCVYADKNNVMLSYIASGENVQQTYSDYIHLIVSALRRMGIDAHATGRNDITVDGRKISGTAFYHLQGRNIVHGTLLYDTDMQNMVASITPADEKLVAKGVKSVQSRIGLLKDYTNLALNDIIQSICSTLCNNTIDLSEEDLCKIREIEQTYSSFEFIRGKNPKWNIVRKGYIENCGTIEIRLNVVCGIIENVEICGDYFTVENSDNKLQRAMQGARFDRASLFALFSQTPSEYFACGLNAEVLINLIFK